MRLKRDPMAVLSAFIDRADYHLSQLKPVRALMGGVWVKTEGVWDQVDVTMMCNDGSRVFSRGAPWQPAFSCHERNSEIQAIETYDGSDRAAR